MLQEPEVELPSVHRQPQNRSAFPVSCRFYVLATSRNCVQMSHPYLCVVYSNVSLRPSQLNLILCKMAEVVKMTQRTVWPLHHHQTNTDHCLQQFQWIVKKLRTAYQQLLSRITQSVYRLVTGWTIRGSNLGSGEKFSARPHRPWGYPASHTMGTGPLPVMRPGIVNDPPHLAPRLKKK